MLFCGGITQAQSDEVEIIAEQVLRIISAKKSITFAAAEEILLTAGGSYVKINGKGIEHGTTGNYNIYAAQHPFTGPKHLPFGFPGMPKHFSNRLDVYDVFWMTGLKGLTYEAQFSDGRIEEGALDEYGRTPRISSSKKEKVKILAGGDEWTFIINETETSALNSNITVQIVDSLFDPIKGLSYQIMDSQGKMHGSGSTAGDGRFTITWTNPNDIPLLCVKKQFTDEYKPLFTIDPRGIQNIILVSPKILREIELDSDDEAGEYRRGNYQVQEGDTIESIAHRFAVKPEFLAAINEIAADKPLTQGVWLNIPTQNARI